MTKVVVEPGICGFTMQVEAIADEDQEEITLKVETGCPSITKMMAPLPATFDAFELCLNKPGKDPLHAYASQNFPVHAACPAISGILKCAEAEAGLALKKNASITFVE